MPWIGVLAALLALAAQLNSVDQQGASEAALKALEAGNPAAAEVLLRPAAAANPADYSIHFNLALALSMQNKDAEAEKELRRTLELEPGLYQAEMNLGILLLRNRRASEAVEPLKAAADAKAGEARPNLLYGQALLESGDSAAAAERYGRAAEADAKSAEAQLGWARALLKTNPGDSEAHYRKAAELDPQWRSALLELAVAYDKAGKADEAIALYREFPASAESKSRLPVLLAAKDDFAAAIPGLEQIAKSAPTLPNRLALAEAYRLNRQPGPAIEQLQLAVAAEAANYDLRIRLGRLLRDERKLVPAAEEFAAAAKIRPDSVEAWNELASALIVNENYPQGLAALDRVRALGREIPGDLYYRAICLDKLKQLKPALEAYQQFVAADGGKMPDQEFVARQRIRIIETELRRR
jgi:tetratricopeptide (TPR) repeat protein